MPTPDPLAQLAAHRSVRQFTGEDIPAETINHILDAARHASTSSLLQAYSAIVVRDPARKSELAGLCGHQQQIVDAPVFIAFCADLFRAEHICRSAGYRFPEDVFEHLMIAIVDTAIFGQHALTCAEALGLGGCMIGGARNNPRVLGKLLQLPKRVFVVFGMTLGHPLKQPRERLRLPLSTIVHHDRYNPATWDDDIDCYDRELRGLGIYRGRRSDLTGHVADWRERHTDATYGWSEHSARRWIDPRAFRRELRQYLDEQGFGFD